MLVIALREYVAAVRTKTFIISLIIMPLMMGGSVLVQALLQDFHDTKAKHFAVIDRTGGRLFPTVEQAVREYNENKTVDPRTGKQIDPRFLVEEVPAPADNPAAVGELREELSERVRKGGLFGFLEIGPDVLKGGAETGGRAEGAAPPDDRRAIRYQSNRPTHLAFPNLVKLAVTAKAEQERLRDSGLKADIGEVRQIMRPVPVEAKGLSWRNPASGAVEDATEGSRFAPVAVPMILMLLMFMVIMMSATPAMQGVVEEKMQRIAEVLLGSVRPFPLMTGKLLGMTAVSLTISLVYLAGVYWAAHRFGVGEFLGGGLLASFVLFQALAGLMYGSLFIAIGAACTDMKETQNLLWPVMLLATLPLFILGNVLQEPNSAVATGLSFFPFATPMLMIARQAVPPGIPWWQPALGALLVLATTLLCVWAAGRIFRVGILMQGKGANVGEMLRWILRG
jgi:ABC-type Na+ efflux pump permease subunit